MRQLARTAQKQHGVWTRRQAATAGIPRRDIARRLADGDWLEVGPDVFRAATDPEDDRGRLLALCLGIGPPVALSGQAAAYVRRFPGVDAPAVPTLAVPARRRVTADGCHVQRSRCFPPVVPQIQAIPVLPRLDTLVTMAAEIAYPTLADCVQELTRQGQLDLEDLHAVLRRGRSGSAMLRRVVAELSAGGDSRPERQLHLALRSAGVGSFELGWELLLSDGTTYRPDLWDDLLGFCIEVDGVGNHSSASRMDSDRVRQNRLVLELGVAVARYTPRRIAIATAAVIAELRAAVRARAAAAEQPRCYTTRRRVRAAS